MSAEGGGEFDIPLYDPSGDGEKGGDTTQPFQPGSASTPFQTGETYLGGEQTEMRTMMHEKSGLPDTSYTETSFGGEEIPLLSDFIHDADKQSMIERAKEKIKKLFPKVDFKKLGPIGFSKNGNQAEIVSFGPRGGESKIFKIGDQGLQKSFTDAKK